MNDKEYKKKYREEHKFELKEYHKRYNQRPEVKERIKNYIKLPEIKLKRDQYNKKYLKTIKGKMYAKIAQKKYCESAEGIEHRKDLNYKRNHGIGLNQFREMLISQNKKCKICNVDLLENNIKGNKQNSSLIDHDHNTGKIRGILCLNCNTILGFAKDNKEILNNAIKYLKEHEVV